MGAKVFIGTPKMRNECVLKKMVWAMYLLSNLHIHKYCENIKNVIPEWGYMYTFNNISAAFSHRLLKFILN